MSFSDFPRLSLEDHKNASSNYNYDASLTPNSQRESIGSKGEENLNTSQRSFGSYCRNLTPLQNNQYMLNGRTSVGKFNQQTQQRFSYYNFDFQQLNGDDRQVYQGQINQESYMDGLTPNRFSNSSNSNFNPHNFNGPIGQSSLNLGIATFGNGYYNNIQKQSAIGTNSLSNRPSFQGEQQKQSAHFQTSTNPLNSNNFITSQFELMEGNIYSSNLGGLNSFINPSVNNNNNMNNLNINNSNNLRSITSISASPFPQFSVPNRNTVMKQSGKSEVITLQPKGNGPSSIGGGVGLGGGSLNGGISRVGDGSGAGLSFGGGGDSFMRSNGGSIVNRNSNFNRVSRGQGSQANGISFQTFHFQPIDINGVPLNTSAGNRQSDGGLIGGGDGRYGDGQNKNNQNGLGNGINGNILLEGCSCQKSRCLKLYCECFANSQTCRPYCQCLDCHNKQENNQDIENARRNILLKNPAAFNSQLEILGNIMLDSPDQNQSGAMNRQDYSNSGVSGGGNLLLDGPSATLSGAMMGYQKGCNCQQTLCRKQYCECFNAGVKCSYLCKCEGCQNCADEGCNSNHLVNNQINSNFTNDGAYDDLKRDQMEVEDRSTYQKQARQLSQFDEEVNLALPQEYLPQRQYSQRIATQRENGFANESGQKKNPFNLDFTQNNNNINNSNVSNLNSYNGNNSHNNNNNINHLSFIQPSIIKSDQFFINSEERSLKERFN